jgi:redox-sensing transcriptional repressor
MTPKILILPGDGIGPEVVAAAVAVIAVPAPHAQLVVDLVVTAGVKAILNFSPGALQVPPEVKLKSVDLTVSLESLSFYLAQGEESS